MISPEKLVEKIKKHFDKTDKHIFITTFIEEDEKVRLW